MFSGRLLTLTPELEILRNSKPLPTKNRRQSASLHLRSARLRERRVLNLDSLWFLNLKRHRNLIGAILCSRFAYLICEAGVASLACAIGVAARRIGYRRDDPPVAVNIDICRSRSAPRE